MMKLVLGGFVWLVLSFTGKVGVWVSIWFYTFILIMCMTFNFNGFGVFVVGYDMGLDTLSFSLVLLSVWLVLLMTMASFMIFKNNYHEIYFVFLLNLLLMFLLLSFINLNYLGFYFFFEASLIPTLLIIAGWGYQPERLQAGVYFMFYTMVSSLPLLLVLMYIYSYWGSLGMLFSWDMNQVGLLGWLVVFGLISAFLVKMPLFFVHLWLPKAHVEAPVSGSMILAGVLLKLGGYGLCRVLDKISNYLIYLSSWGVSLGLVAMGVVGIMCCRLNDMKALVAYSSVAHMGMVVMGLFIMSTWGYNGALMMMLGHGLSSSGLFCSLNMYYERTSSRSFFINSGMLLILPSLSMMFFLLCVSNIASPPSINLLSEMYLMASIMGYDMAMLLIFPAGSFMGAVFSIFLFSFSQHGSMGSGAVSFWTLTQSEIMSLILHVVPLNFLVLKFELFMLWM
uniref:NADH-ubiquinone oxidoreductase chain 4 n=1 Tax=Tullbergia bisetosa TaxID=345630 RepID=A0A5P9W7N0_9HEXA|nr:NADH dehydrogenase subunit 4 [Tullbergia bisetosa]